MNVKRFQKNREDFLCENCGTKNIGNGFTNHCKECLFSKHVDIFPGDRFEECHGLMEIVDYESKIGKNTVTHKCKKCGEISKNKLISEDNFDTYIKIVKEINSKKEQTS